MKIKHSLLNSINCAIEGIITACKIERNMKIHVFFTVIVLTASLFLRLETKDFIYLSFSITFVWVAELLNSAIEKAVDLTIGTEYHELARQSKDIAAGAVFVAAINAVIIGYLVFIDHIRSNGNKLFEIFRASYANKTLFILILVSVIVIILKTFFYKEHKGTPIQGGMPSGHSALAFSILSIVIEMNENFGVRGLTFLLAILVAQSRVKNKIHTVKEVLVGGIIGFSVSYFILYILRITTI